MAQLCNSSEIKDVMDLDRRISAFVELGKKMKDPGFLSEQLLAEAKSKNQWFTEDSIRSSVNAISEYYLEEERIREWLLNYNLKEIQPKLVGLVLAANIPLVGFHDILSVLITGNSAMIKLSDRDTVLMNRVLDTLIEIESEFADRIVLIDRLKDYDAIIATGSDTTANYFHKYFSNVDHIIRSNRHAVAIVMNSDDEQSLKGLDKDVFMYFGLGCRNVSKIYIQEGYDVTDLFNCFKGQSEIIHHNKYKNNYDYNHALFLLNKEKFFTNDFVLLKEDEAISSRIASLHFEEFSDLDDLRVKLDTNSDQIQCILSSSDLQGLTSFRFGHAQSPGLMDYADGVDTIEFLLNIHND